MTKVLHFFTTALERPLAVATITFAVLLMGLMMNGSRLLFLIREEAQMKNEIESTKAEILKVEKLLSKAKSPQFIEQEARERLDMISEDELMFVFSE